MSNITIQELFASAKPKLHAEPITWDGKTATLYFQRLSYGEGADLALPFLNDTGTGLERGRAKDYQAAVIASTLRDKHGASGVVTSDDVLGWDPVFYAAVQAASEKHNPAVIAAAVEDAAKNSETTPSAATS